MQVVVVETPELGDRSYLVHDGSFGFVVDAQRDIDKLLSRITSSGIRVTHVFETHIHNDYVTGGLALAKVVGADYCVAAADSVEFARRAVKEGDTFESGSLTVRALHTPGHTPNHLSYAVLEAGTAVAVLTGGSLLYGTVGRTDLISSELTESLTRDQYRSARRLMAEVPPDAQVLPTHGFGSFCASSGTSSAGAGNIASERAQNVAATTDDETAFVASIIAGLGPYPSYYSHMAPLNRLGPTAFAEITEISELDSEALRVKLEGGSWVIDTRPRRQFAAAHLQGTVGMELSSSFSTYAGWLSPFDTSLTLLTDGLDDFRAARRALSRIGLDRLEASTVGFAGHSAQLPVRGYPVTDFARVAQGLPEAAVVLDVRQSDEWRSGHISGSRNVPIQELPGRMREIPRQELWVHCGVGYRASVAASLLDRAGHSVVLIDDDFDNAKEAGLPIQS
ncbi:MAG: MBL fold metallo-hydrolase [Candidatus Dormibacteria bacterium]